MNENKHLSGKRALVTGATSGIGYVTARQLAAQGAQVILVGRNPEKTAACLESIRHEVPGAQLDYLLGDLSNIDQVQQISERFTQHYNRLDILVNNAGAIFWKRQVSIDNLEMTFTLDHLSYFQLTLRLMDALITSGGGRVINVSSGAHIGGHIHFEDMHLINNYKGFSAYSQAKLANVLFTYELSRRLEGIPVTVNALHPGFIASNFAKNNGSIVKIGMLIASPFALSPEEGAQTSVFLASSPDVESTTGKYFVNCAEAPSSQESYDLQVARRLWEISADLTGVGEISQ